MNINYSTIHSSKYGTKLYSNKANNIACTQKIKFNFKYLLNFDGSALHKALPLFYWFSQLLTSAIHVPGQISISSDKLMLMLK